MEEQRGEYFIELGVQLGVNFLLNVINPHLPQAPPASSTPLQQKQQQQPPPRCDPAGRVQRVPLELGQTSGAVIPVVDASLAPATAAAGTQEDDEYAGDYADEVDQNQIGRASCRERV